MLSTSVVSPQAFNNTQEEQVCVREHTAVFLSTRDKSSDVSLGEKERPLDIEKTFDESSAASCINGSHITAITQTTPVMPQVTSDCSDSHSASTIEHHKAPNEKEPNSSASNAIKIVLILY